ncbi:DUF1853 family protein [Planctomicrobium sp.]|nr:DUF1853 family protein [Planctomicrobium sp.]MDB4743980.1 DUF1853 family protein [Planctomicrobium sp.]
MPIHAQQILDDLNWTIKSPSLIVPSRHCHSLIDLYGVDVDQLVRHFEKSPPYKVGRYFESLVGFWLRDIRGLEIIEHQKQIFAGTQTLGEIDFLYRDEQDDVVHLEVAVKFYLHFPDEHISGSHFIGPNSNDNLEAKHRKLFDHQLKLGFAHFECVDRAEAFVKGRVFYSEPPTLLQEMLSGNHLRGHWIYSNELDWIDKFGPQAQFKIIQKPHWLSEVHSTESNPQFISIDELKSLIQEHFADSIRPLLIAHMENNEDLWGEECRFFIVNPGWPHLIASR